VRGAGPFDEDVHFFRAAAPLSTPCWQFGVDSLAAAYDSQARLPLNQINASVNRSDVERIIESMKMVAGGGALWTVFEPPCSPREGKSGAVRHF
jgi:hypothetical protein